MNWTSALGVSFMTMWFGAQGSRGGVDRLHEGSRWGEWEPNLNLRSAAENLVSYLNAKNWVRITAERMRFVASSPAWSKFLDPGSGTADGLKIVLSDGSSKPLILEIRPIEEFWTIRESSWSEIKNHDGLIWYLTGTYTDYISCHEADRLTVLTLEQYLSAWVDLGNHIDKGWHAWLRVVGSPEEARSWASLGCDVAETRRWKSMLCDLSEVEEWMNLAIEVDQAQLWKSLRCEPSEAIEWMRNGCDFVEAKRWKEKGCRITDALSWFSIGATFVDAAKWINSGWSTGDSINEILRIQSLGNADD
jgi:hypothetical protein